MLHSMTSKKYADVREIASFSWVDSMVWHVFLKSHPDSAYKGIIWKLVFEFSKYYPFRPPKVTFETPLNRMMRERYVIRASQIYEDKLKTHKSLQ